MAYKGEWCRCPKCNKDVRPEKFRKSENMCAICFRNKSFVDDGKVQGNLLRQPVEIQKKRKRHMIKKKGLVGEQTYLITEEQQAAMNKAKYDAQLAEHVAELFKKAEEKKQAEAKRVAKK